MTETQPDRQDGDGLAAKVQRLLYDGVDPVLSKEECEFVLARIRGTTPMPAPDAMRPDAMEILRKIEFGCPQGRCPYCLGWDEKADAGRPNVHTADCKLAAALSAPVPPPDGAAERNRWFLASQSDGLFIINSEPRPSNDDQWHDRPDGPSIVLNVTELPEAKAIKIVGVMNELALPSATGAAEPMAQNEIHSSGSGVESKTRKELSADPQSLIAAGNVDRLGVAPGLPDFNSAREAMREACDLLAERKYGNPARSPGHNARLCLESALRIPVQLGAGKRDAARILRGWAKAYRDTPEHRFPSDPNAEFFPVDLENAADLLAPSRQAPQSSRKG